MGGNYKRIIKFFLESKKKHLLAFICLLGSSIMTIILPYSTMTVVDSAVGSESFQKVIFFAIVYLLAATISKVLILISNHLYLDISRNFTTKLRMKICIHLTRLDGDFFVNANAGELYTILSEDVERIQGLAGKTLPNLITGIFTAIPIIIFMLIAEPLICILLLIIVPFIIIIQNLYLIKIQRKFNDCRVQTGISNSILQEFLSQLMDIVFLNADNFFICKLHKKFKEVEMCFIKYGSVCYFRSFWLGMASVASSVVIIAVGGYGVSKKILSIGMVFAILQNYQTAISPIIMIADFLASYKECKISIDRIFNLLDKTSNINNTTKIKQNYTGEDIREINYQNVSFFYRKDTYILSNVTMKFEKGKIVALVGESGSGKTTLLNLLYCFWKPYGGSILLNSVDLNAIEIRWLRNKISVVSQNIVLFNDTILNNICLGDASISSDKVKDVCNDCGLTDFINELPLGIKTVVGERGINLSGGQKQRIEIARALIRKASIILFDEATSALDNNTENIIKETILKYKKDCIIIIIAHRLSTVIDADQIYVMKSGKIVEEGNHKKLMEIEGYYHKMYFTGGNTSNLLHI